MRERCFVCGAQEGRVAHRTRDRLYGLPGSWDLWECGGCGLMTLLDAPEGDALSAYYPKRASEETQGIVQRAPPPGPFDRRHYLAAFGPRWSPLRLVPLRGVKRGAVLRPGARHLDVGCHTGDFLDFTRSFGMEVEGVELDPHAAEVARSRGIKVHLGTLFDAKLPDRSFDLITLNHVFEHLPDPEQHLDELRRLLKDHGTLILATPNPRSAQRAWFKDAWVHLDSPRHLYLYPPRVLAQLAGKHGLAPVRTRYLSSYGYLLKSARYRRNDRTGRNKSYFEPHGGWDGRWPDRLAALPLGLVDALRWGDEYEMWLRKA